MTEPYKKTSVIPKSWYPLFIGISFLFFFACSHSKETVSEQQGTIEQESVLNRYIYQQRDTLKKSRLTLSDSINVDSLLSRMSLEEKIGQLFITYASGYYYSSDNEFYMDLAQKIRDYHIGGIMFSNGNIYAQTVLLNKLQKISNIPLWVAQDMEYGAAMRVRRTTRFTPAMGIAATGYPEYAYWVGKITAREAKALGVHQIFAPVLDVNNNPDNPVINVRSFSGDPSIVSNYGTQVIKGIQSEGVVATAKHFPGHGDTNIDSHLSLPIISYDYARLDSIELVPFRAAIEEDISSIMSAHIAFPKIGNSRDLPSTMDPSILNRILIDSLNFNGIVITDGLEMSGVSSQFSPGEAVVQALKAGADLMLLSPDEFTAIHELKRKVKQGIISEKRIDHSVRKLLHWKKKYDIFENHSVDIEKLSDRINLRNYELLADEIARKSITVVKNEDDILPILPHKFPKVLVVSIADDQTGQTGSYFASKLRDFHPDLSFHVYDKRTSEEEKEKILQKARDADLVILGSFIYVRSHKPIQLTPEQISFLKKITANGKKTILTAFGNPYVVRDLPETDVHVMAWASDNNQVQNTVPALFGASSVTGKMPINIPGMYSIGDGLEIPQTTIRVDEPETVGIASDSLEMIEQVMQKAVLDSTFPGGVVTVLKDGVIAYQEGFGYHTYDKLKKVESDAIYDLASLTKVIATTTAVMKLTDEGKISLNDPVSRYIPEFKQGDKANITIRNLLVHNSGLPPFRVYVDELKQRREIIEAIKNEPIIAGPGTKYIYSDLGYILLGEIVEKVTGMRLDRYLRRNFYYPMGMNSTYFNPSKMGRWIKRRIPPTEIDTVFRNRLIRGQVHDERAFYMDGVAGHAGLFSSGKDLAVFAQMIMNGGSYGGQRLISEETVSRFITHRSEKGNRALGFDRKSEGFSTAGTLTGPNTFGHLGFTGTSLWIDPDRNLAIILLTNRTYPYRSYGKEISTVRSAVADAVIRSIKKP